jgi:starvation-inducible outer membrane lipoprotein
MPNRLKLLLTLTLASLLLGGCMQVPDDLPPLAMCAPADQGVAT